MADEDIVQKVRIEVEGGDEGESAFAKLKSSFESAIDAMKEAFGNADFSAAWDKLKEAGTKAFEALKQAASQGFGSIVETASAGAEAIGTALLAIGIAAAGVAVAIGVIGRAMFGFVESTSKAVNALGELADKTNESIEVLSGLQTFFAQSGVSANEFASTYRKLANVVTQTWREISKESKDGADKLESSHLAAEQAANRLIDAQRRLAKTNSDVAKQQRDDQNQVVDAEQRLQELQNAKSRSKGLDTTQSDKRIAKQKQENDLARAQQSIQDAIDKQAEDSVKQRDERSRRDLERRQADRALRQAEKAQREAERNDLGNITDAVQQAAEGNASALKTVNATADNIVKGIVNSAAEAGQAVSGLGDNFNGVVGSAPAVTEVLTKLGQVLKNIEDPALRSEVATKALGNASQDFIKALETGKIEEFVQKIRDMGGVISDTDKKIAGDFTSALRILGDTLEQVKVGIASAFGKDLTEVVKIFGDTLNDSKDNLIRLAGAIADTVVPPLKIAALAFKALVEVGNLTADVLRNVFNLIKSLLGFGDLPIVKSMERLFEILKGVAQILSGDIKKGLESLSNERGKERKEDQKQAADKAKQLEDQQKGQAPVKPGEQRPLEPTTADRFLDSAKQLLDPAPLFNDIKDKISKLVPEQQPVQPPVQEPQKLDELKNSTNGLKQTFDGAKEGVSSFVDTIKRNIENLNKPPEEKPKTPEELKKTEAVGPQTPKQPEFPTSPFPPAVESLLDKIGGFLNQFKDQPLKSQGPVSGLGARAEGEDATAKTALDGVTTSAQQLASALDTAATSAKQDGGEGAQAADTALQSTAESAQIASTALNSLSETGDAAASATSALQQLASAAQAAAQAASSGGGGGDVAVATGGLISGPGTSTSDSIRAWLSHGEFVQPTRATRHYGREFMESVRSLKFPKFNTGGMVGLLSPALPRFATGGLVEAGAASVSIPHLGTVDLTTNHGTMRVAVDNTSLSQLRRASVLRNIGKDRQPGWVK